MSIPVAMLLLLCAVLPANTAFADNGEFDPNSIVTKSFVLLDGDTGAVIAQKDPDAKVRPSSTTKVMTALLLLEHKGSNLDEEVTVGAEVNPFNAQTNSLMGLKQNETVKLRELLYGMMIVSGNDAANAVAIVLTEKKDKYEDQVTDFAKMMNDKAAELGMKNTQFANPHGLFNEEHYTTAYDMAILAAEAMKHEEFRKVVSTKEHEFEKTNMHEAITKRNTNRLLVDTKNEDYTDLVYEHCIGIKTGLARDDEGKMSGSLIAAAEKDGKTLILAIMGDTSDITTDDGQRRENMMRFSEAKKIFEFGFSAESTDITNLVTGTPVSATLSGEQSARALKPVLSGDKAEFIGSDEEFIATLGSATVLEYDVKLNDDLAPPYTEGQVVGTVQYRLGDQNVYYCDVAVADASSAPLIPTDNAQQPGPGDTTSDGGSSKIANLSANRSFMIAMLSIALMALIIMFARVMTAPRRKRRSRNMRRRYY